MPKLPEPDHDVPVPVLVLVGRPNVGKSTLFNRLTGTRDALVADLPGLTRDRQYGFGSAHGRRFVVVDTGGLMPDTADGLARLAESQAHTAMQEASVILFLTDARAGWMPGDKAIAETLRRLDKPVQLLVNKTEGQGAESTAEFHRSGLGEACAVSAQRGDGVDAVLEMVLQRFPPSAAEVLRDDTTVRIAVMGRPNAGKSTFVNRIVGSDRVLSSDQPGTTRDSIRVPFAYEGAPFELIDTAGIRRRANVEEGIEKLSVIKALQAVEMADVVIAMTDAQAEVGGHDARLMALVAARGRGMVLAVNKWDGLSPDDRQRVKDAVDFKMPFLDFVPLHFISALHGSGLGELMKDVKAVYTASRRSLRTPALTQALERFVTRNPPPAVTGRRIKLRYAHQGGDHPPVIVVHGNQTDRLPVSYQRYLANCFRKEFQLRGIPLRLEFKTGDNPFKGKRNILTPRQLKSRARGRERR